MAAPGSLLGFCPLSSSWSLGLQSAPVWEEAGAAWRRSWLSMGPGVGVQQSLQELTALGEAGRRQNRRSEPGPVGPWTQSPLGCAWLPLPGRAGTASILKATWFYLKTSPSLRRCKVGCPTLASCGLVSGSTMCLSFNREVPRRSVFAGPLPPRPSCLSGCLAVNRRVVPMELCAGIGRTLHPGNL